MTELSVEVEGDLLYYHNPGGKDGGGITIIAVLWWGASDGSDIILFHGEDVLIENLNQLE